MDTLQNMRVFMRVAELGSFTAASESMNITLGGCSRAVSDLEEHLRTRLMNRTTRRLALTPAGQRYQEHCRLILAQVALAEEEAQQASENPTGTLRIASYASLGQHYLLPTITSYREKYPDVRVELNMSQSAPDLFGGGEVAVVPAPSLNDSEMIAHEVGSTFSILCASPAYIRENGMPTTPSELSQHACLMLDMPAYPADKWTLDGPTGSEVVLVNGPIQVNIAESLAVAIRGGHGIGVLPLYSAIDALREGKFVRVLPQYTLLQMKIFVLYPSKKFVDAKTRTWVSFACAHLTELIARDKRALVEELNA